MEKFVKGLLFGFLMLSSMIITCLLIQDSYNWFVVPVYNIRPILFSQAVGLYLFINLFMYAPEFKEQDAIARVFAKNITVALIYLIYYLFKTFLY